MLDELQRGMEDVAEIQNEDQSSTQNWTRINQKIRKNCLMKPCKYILET